MFESKFNVYKTEWLDLVFANRNKSYGAYELRLHNSETTLKALLIGSLLAFSLTAGPLIYKQLNKSDIAVDDRIIDDRVVTLTNVVMPKIEQAKQQEEAAPKAEASKPVKTQKFVTLTVVPAPQVIEELPTTAVLQQSVISNVTTEEAKADAGAIIEKPSTGTGGNGAAENGAVGNEVYGTESLSKYPEFPGGQEAFAKFLRKNLRYPSQAVENNTTGRVFVSFVVEKDGTLTAVKVIRGIGDGCDEEALRVLKKAPAWSPGEQNGQKVRVAYTIPIYFQLGG